MLLGYGNEGGATAQGVPIGGLQVPKLPGKLKTDRLMQRLLRVFAVSALVAAGVPALARADAAADCFSEDIERRIEGCTALIDRHDPSMGDLSLAYAMRALAFVQTVGFVDRVPCLVPENPPAFRFSRTFDLQHLRTLEPHEARMREIEGNGKPEDAVGTEELLRQPGMGQRDNVVDLQLAMQPPDPARHQGAFELQWQVA